MLGKSIFFIEVLDELWLFFSIKKVFWAKKKLILGPYSRKSWHATFFTNKLFFCIESGMPLFSRIWPLVKALLKHLISRFSLILEYFPVHNDFNSKFLQFLDSLCISINYMITQPKRKLLVIYIPELDVNFVCKNKYFDTFFMLYPLKMKLKYISIIWFLRFWFSFGTKMYKKSRWIVCKKCKHK
jgi:hypothetical protein